jgi:hypothetical protein
MKAHCAWCDAPTPLMAKFCPECGAANPARRTVLGIAATVAVMVPAIAIAIYAAIQWEQPLIKVDGPAEQSMPTQPVTGSDPAFDWLAAAMKSCDDKAASDPGALNLLVVPLTFDAKDIDQWRRQAINRIGNAMVLPSNDMLDGLRRKALSIASEPYSFSVRDEKTRTVRKWASTGGVQRLSAPGAEDIALLSMQFRPRDKGSDEAWGNPIVHQKGNCYWVNALFEE